MLAEAPSSLIRSANMKFRFSTDVPPPPPPPPNRSFSQSIYIIGRSPDSQFADADK